MDSIVSAALSEICSQGVNGISLTELWPTLQNSLSSSGLSLCDGVKKAIWNRVLSIPGLQFEANKSSFGSEDPSIQSFEEAEELGLKIVAAENLRDSFVGLYDLKAADAGISPPQRRALERLASARSDGITQSQLAKEFGMKGNNIFYVVRNLECQGLIVRQSTIVRTKESNAEGESASKNTSIVNTNLMHLYRYAKHLNSQQRLEITKTDALESLTSADGSRSTGDSVAGDHVKDDVLVKDYLPALRAVCDMLEEADGKVLVVSDIKQALNYRRTPGHRAWRNLCNRLKDARLVEEFNAEVNRKVVSCLRLLKKFDEKHFQPKSVPCGPDNFDTDQPGRCGTRGQVTEQLLELPIEHQIHDMIAAEGTKGLTVNEVCKRLGLNNKRNYTRLLNMFSRFGCHLQAESHNRSVLYRVWTSGNFTAGSSISPPGESADVVNGDKPSKQRVMDLVLHGMSDAAMLQSDSLTSKEEFAIPGKIESGRIGLEHASSRLGNGENKQIITYKKRSKKMLTCGSKPPDLVGESGDAADDAELDRVPTPSPLLSNPSRIRSSYPRYPCLTLTATSAQREQRILERLQKEKFVLIGELYRWLESLEKDKPTTMAKKTLLRTLNKLQEEKHCKCVHISVPVVTNCGSSRTTEVVLHKSVTLVPELLGQIHERVRFFDMQSRGQGLSRLKNEKPVPVLTAIKRIISCESSDSQAVRAEAMRANGFVAAKMVRSKLLHNFLWCYLSSSPGWDDALSSGRHGYDLKNPHSTCKLFALTVAIKAMPLELFLQVVGSTHKFEDLIESCKHGLCLSDLSPQDYKSLMDTQATGRLSWIIDILRRLKLIRLVTDGRDEDANITPLSPHTILTHAMELKPYIEEPVSRVPLSLGVSSDLRPRIRHDFILSNKEAIDIYWKTLEYCYATADPTAAVHAFPGSAVQEVFLYRSWASVRVMTADQRSELIKRVVKDDPDRKISFADCVKIARDINLTLEQVLRVSNDKKRLRLHRFQSDFIVNGDELELGTSNCRSASQKRKKSLKEQSSKHIKYVNGQSSRQKMLSLSVRNGQYTEEENPITNHAGDQEVHLQECEEETHAHSPEELGTNEEDREDSYDYISQCAFSKQKPTRQPKFLWTETSDRQLVIQYVRYRSTLGAKYYRTGWGTLPDLPAPPETCRRRMSFLRRNQTVRRAVTRLCNLLAERFAKHLDKSKEKKLFNHDGSGHIVQNSSIDVYRNFSNCFERNLESDFENQRWDDFEDQNIRGALYEVLRCIRIAKLEGYKRSGLSPEKEWPDRNLDAQACDFQELDLSPSATATAQKIQNNVGKRQRRSNCHHLPGKFLKLLNEGISVSRRAYESLAVANAVELLKLVFLSTSISPEVPTLLAETLRRYSEHDLFAAFNYLREKKFMVSGNGSHPFVLSQQFLHNVSSSPFPINTGKRASKLASWLCEKEKDLTEEGIHLNTDLQCGDIFHLLALVSSGELFMSPCLPDEGVGEAEEKRSSKNKSYEDEVFNGDQVKKFTSLLMNDGGECVSRREKGFPGIKVSLIRATISRADAVDLLRNEEIGTSSSRFDENDQSTCYTLGISDSLSLFNQLNSSNILISAAPVSGTIDESPWKAMTSYGEYLMSSLSDEERVGPLYPELFQTVHSTIRKSGDQGLSMQKVSHIREIDGDKMAEVVVDVLRVFGLALKVNAYDHVHVVDASFRSKYFLSSADGRYQDLKPSPQTDSPRPSDGNHVKPPQEYVTSAESSLDLDVHKVTILNLPEEVLQLSDEAHLRKENVRFEDNIQVEVVSSERINEGENFKCTTSGDSHSHSFRPILPWINGDGTTNPIVYKGLSRRVLGIVMQNPGILEDDLIHRMDTLNPQNCRKLLELMVLDNHLIVRKMYQTTSSSPPSTLQSLFGSNFFKKSDSICRDHFFANPMSTSLL